jgi:hypothetical protein
MAFDDDVRHLIQPEEKRHRAGEIRKKLEEARASASRISFESIWMNNIAYLLGYSGVKYNAAAKAFQPVNRYVGTRWGQLKQNKILPNAQIRLARLIKNPPRWEVVPESNSTEDKDAAAQNQQLLVSAWENLQINEKRIPMFMWMQQCGGVFAFAKWDEYAGGVMEDPLTGEVGFKGDVKFEPASAFEVFPNPQATTIDEVRSSWVIRAKIRPLDYFVQQYGEMGKLVKEEDTWLLSAQYMQRVAQSTPQSASTSGLSAYMKNSAIEITMYEAPSPKHPRGRLSVAASGVMLEEKELPIHEIPIVYFPDTVVGGRLLGETPITHARPIVDQYNEILRRIQQWTNRMAAGKYAMARGAGLAKQALDDESGEVLFFDPVPTAPNGGAPIPLTPPPIPSYLFEELKLLDTQLAELFGNSEISKGNLPSASIPAVGMQMLVEADDTRVGAMVEQHEHEWAMMGHFILRYMEEFYEIPRKIKMLGKQGEYSFKEIAGADIRKNTHVRVIKGSTLPGSRTLRRQEAINLYQLGVYGPPGDPKTMDKLTQSLEFGDVTDAWQDYHLDMSQIKRGLEQLEQGIPVEVDKLDNHMLWMQELNRYRKGDKFSTLSPDAQQLIKATIDAHADAVIALTQPPQGMPPPPGANPELAIADETAGAPNFEQAPMQTEQVGGA